ncbi:MAG TPA: hypothetical protein VEP73_12075, partial [Actinomycetota bacterium]|nr:hypothetical protein [Actinomycetota bacterium]
MNGWCPRCDALRGRAAVCPVCHTPLAGLEPERPAAPALPAGAAPAGAAAGPPRIRVALAVAAVVVAGIAFVAGRAGGAGVRPRGGPAATVPATTAGPQPADQRRALGWSSASRGGVRVTAVAIDRGQEPGEDADAGRLHLRVDGLEPGERVLAFKDLRLRDTGRGLFASPDRSVVGETSGAEALPEAPHGSAVPAQDDQRTYAVSLGPTPPPSQLATVQVGGLVVGRTDGATIGLDTPTPWPDQGPGRAAGLGTDDVTVSPWPREAGIAPLRLEVTAAFVGAGRA